MRAGARSSDLFRLRVSEKQQRMCHASWSGIRTLQFVEGNTHSNSRLRRQKRRGSIRHAWGESGEPFRWWAERKGPTRPG